MTNDRLFLKVYKDLFGIGLNPLEILIVSQILEYQTKQLDCFISDESFANDFGVSVSTISRAIKALEVKGFIQKTTKNIKGGKMRYLYVNESNINAFYNKQIDNCTISKLPIDNEQNDLIKDNIKDKIIKDNSTVLSKSKDKLSSIKEVLDNSTNSNGSFNF